MKTETELRGMLAMVLARLDGDPNTEDEWRTIRDALRSGAFYAERQMDACRNGRTAEDK